ncbi:HNH endonuclease [Mycolicibacterium sp. S2-37]|uniref:HNH endonuclease signature motif containing protein n=1 Tax=Mycolicibacterium sp. S2-37 TaxID=2810297 RepID=UPI001A9461A3|nr:HNH endonuclease signature motif containing protein [Mycolicibacterium sp. S2-37]MBO0676827.1 HNH endonuclease [Mycolicibacterium sp. S2-37]
MRNARCVHCRQPIDYSAPRNHPESFEADHIYPVKTHPHRAYDPTNLQPSHSKCNRERGATPYVAKKWVQPDW